MTRPIRWRPVVGVIALVAMVALIQWFRAGPDQRWARSDDAAPGADRPSAPHAASVVPPTSTVPMVGIAAGAAADSPSGAPTPAALPDMPPPGLDVDSLRGPWPVDLDAVRAALPDNLYWKLSAPTTDPDTLEWREQERARWNVEYGKVLSGTATEEEIRAYYDQRARLSGDYVEFATYVLDHYTQTLSEQDAGLLTLARRLHLARLEEIPRKVEEAIERKHLQDKAREEWLADQAEFEGGETDGD